MMASVVCYSEDVSRLAELITFAKAASQSVLAITTSIVQEGIASFGEDELIVAGPVEPQKLDVEGVCELIKKHISSDTKLVLLSATKFGKEVASRLGAKLDTAVSNDCKSFVLEQNSVKVVRMVLSGNGVSTEELSKLPAIVSLQSGLLVPKPSEKSANVIRVGYTALSKSLTLEVKSKGGGVVKLEDAEKIVAVGRGVQKREDLSMIEKLAAVLGAAVGCSRPLAADLGWLSDDQWIGLSGKKVKPKLYIAIGISGQVQHIAGMRDSKVVVAINKDPNAPIFANSDYCIVGDLYAIVPELIKALSEKESG
jgi:electron transfer flavoprotein alpha subunit